MDILKINNKKDEKFLRQETRVVKLEKKNIGELRKLARQMRKKMQEANGIGLSANQVGINKKLFVAQLPDEQDKPKFYAIFNPKITRRSSEKVTLEEGCLSIPENYGLVPRANKITLEGQTVDGRKIKIKARGLLARVFQHEVDHLEGKLFVDKAKEVYRTENQKEGLDE